MSKSNVIIRKESYYNDKISKLQEQIKQIEVERDNQPKDIKILPYAKAVFEIEDKESRFRSDICWLEKEYLQSANMGAIYVLKINDLYRIPEEDFDRLMDYIKWERGKVLETKSNIIINVELVNVSKTD